MSFEEELNHHLGPLVSDSKLLAECAEICSIYNKTPEDLKFKWEAICYSVPVTLRLNGPSTLTMDSIGKLREQLARELAHTARKNNIPRPPPGMAVVDRARMPAFMAPRTSGVQVKTEPGHENGEGSSKVSFRGVKNDKASRKKRAYHYMYERPNTRSEVLDERIGKFADILREAYGIADFEDPTIMTPGEITAIGRIVHDADSSSGGKLTGSTVVLETSRQTDGRRIPLQFNPTLKIRGAIQGTTSSCIFPGAIVALKGSNTGIGQFQVSEILALPVPSISSPTLVAPGKRDPFTVCIACGTPTDSGDLKFAPWKILVQYLRQKKPDVIVLTGPFLDASHPSIQTGNIDHPMKKIFKDHFVGRLRAVLNSCPGTIAVLVPSPKDVLHSHPVFPQPELDSELFSNDPRIYLVPNPAQFSINGVKFGATSVNFLAHMQKEQYMQRGEVIEPPMNAPGDIGSDTFGNFCRQILQQRSFYPIFPPPNDFVHDVNLDVTHSEGLDIDEDAPEVLILPSHLKQFVKRVHDTIAINPSFMLKMWCANLMVDPSKPTGLGDGFRFQASLDKLEYPKIEDSGKNI